MKQAFFAILLVFSLSGSKLCGQYRHTYLQLGEIELHKKNYQEALNYFTHYIEGHTGMYEGYFLRGLAKYYLDDLIGAEYDLTRAISCLPEYPRLFLVRGVIRAETYKIPQALIDYNTAIMLDSTYTEAYYYRLLVYYSLKKIDDALNDCNIILKQDSSFTGIHTLRGTLLMEKERFDEAITDFNNAIAEDEEDNRTYIERGKAYAKLGDYDKAMLDFDKAISLDSTGSYVYFQRALVYMDQLEYEKALRDLNKVIEISPQNELAYFNRAIIKNSENLQEEAVNDLIRILDQNPDNVLVYYNIGLGLAKLGNVSGAFESFSKAIELYPDYEDAYYQRALLRKKAGDIDGAYKDMNLYEAIVERNKNKDDTLKKQESIALLKLTHLESDFLNKEEKEKQLQFKKIDVRLRQPFQVLIDTLTLNKSGDYQLVSMAISNNSDVIERNWFNQKMGLLDSLLKVDPYNSELYLSRGLLYHMAGAYEQAIQDFSKSLSFDNKNHIAYMCRGNTLLAQLYDYTLGNTMGSLFTEFNQGLILRTYSDAVFNFQNAFQLKEDYLFARFNLAYAHFLFEDFEASLKEFQFVSKLKKISDSSYNAGLLLLFLGKNEEACSELGLAGQLGLPEAYPVIRKYCR